MVLEQAVYSGSKVIYTLSFESQGYLVPVTRFHKYYKLLQL